MATGWLDQGRVKGLREAARKQLDKKFGPLAPERVQRLDTYSVEKIDEILLAFADAKSLDELGLGTVQPS